MDYLIQLDINLFYLINGSRNLFLDELMPFITEPYNWLPTIIIGMAVLFYYKKWSGLRLLVMILITVGLSDFIASSVLKPFFVRIRPCHVLDPVYTLVNCSSSKSFPSSHASNIFALFITGSYICRKAFIPLCILAIMIGYSRIYVGVHYPFDVIGGYISGLAVSLFAIWIFRKYSPHSNKEL